MALVPISSFLNDERTRDGQAVANVALYVYERDTTTQGMYDEAGPSLPWDALSTHPYPVGARSGVSTGSASFGFHKGLDAVRTVRDAHGDDSPIWITETGYERQTSQSPRQEEITQGPVNALLRGIASRMDDVDAVVLHTLHASAADPYDHVNLGSLSFRPVAQAVGA